MIPSLHNSDSFRRQVMSTFSFISGILIFILVPVRHLVSAMPAVGILLFLSCGMLLFAVTLMSRRGVSLKFCGSTIVASLSLIGLFAGYFNGGVRAPACIVFVGTPVIGFFCCGRFGANLAVVLSFFGFVFLLFCEQVGLIHPTRDPESFSRYLSLIYFAGTLMIYFVGMAYEQSRRLAEEQVAKLTMMAAHLNKLTSLGEMAAGLAHEINNPLGMITGNIPLLLKFKDDPEKFVAKADRVMMAADRIGKIIRGLKKFSRADGDAVREVHSLTDIVQDAVVLTNSRVLHHSIDLEVLTDGALNIRCDSIEIEQVLINLINNAVDAIKESSKKWIKVKAEVVNNQVILQVIDSGLGISPAIEAKIFEPFFTTKAVGEGTGLGLSITKGILDHHGATIVLNRSVQNTCFEIRFPLAAEVANAA